MAPGQVVAIGPSAPALHGIGVQPRRLLRHQASIGGPGLADGRAGAGSGAGHTLLRAQQGLPEAFGIPTLARGLSGDADERRALLGEAEAAENAIVDRGDLPRRIGMEGLGAPRRLAVAGGRLLDRLARAARVERGTERRERLDLAVEQSGADAAAAVLDHLLGSALQQRRESGPARVPQGGRLAASGRDAGRQLPLRLPVGAGDRGVAGVDLLRGEARERRTALLELGGDPAKAVDTLEGWLDRGVEQDRGDQQREQHRLAAQPAENPLDH
jgi:hypothetical protein